MDEVASAESSYKTTLLSQTKPPIVCVQCTYVLSNCIWSQLYSYHSLHWLFWTNKLIPNIVKSTVILLTCWKNHKTLLQKPFWNKFDLIHLWRVTRIKQFCSVLIVTNNVHQSHLKLLIGRAYIKNASQYILRSSCCFFPQISRTEF